ncbi:MAG: lipid A-modifier LpxR family protein [Rhodoferax sp.]
MNTTAAKLLRHTGVFLAGAALACAAAAQESTAHAPGTTTPTPDPAGTVYLRMDNDLWGLRSHSDQNYTMGFAARWVPRAEVGASAVDAHPLFGALDALAEHAWWLDGPAPVGGSTRNRAMTVGVNAFTPDCLDTAARCAAKGHPITESRPYDALVFTGVSRKRRDGEHSASSAEFNLGVHGTSVGRVVQTRMHEICCADNIPQEWDTQIGQGGAPTFLYKQTRHHYADLGPVELEGKYGLWLGWNTWPTAGVVASWGPLRLEYDASYVLYDESLQGALLGRNPMAHGYADVERLVTLMHFQVDVTELLGPVLPGGAPKHWGLEWQQNWKTRELKLPGVEAIHRWGSLTWWMRY